jgi:hypothetical protein
MKKKAWWRRMGHDPHFVFWAPLFQMWAITFVLVMAVAVSCESPPSAPRPEVLPKCEAGPQVEVCTPPRRPAGPKQERQ